MSPWLIISVLGYFLLAFEGVFSKFLLTGKVKDWKLYSFYVGLLSLNGIIFAPFGIIWRGWLLIGISLLSGVVFYLGLIFLYKALQSSSASRVYFLFGAIVTSGTLLWEHLLMGQSFSVREFLGVFFLLLGGMFISFKIYKLKFFSNYKNAFWAGFLVSFALVLLKYAFDNQNFVTGYVFSRLGIFVSAMALLFSPAFRVIVKKNFSKQERKNQRGNFLGVIMAKTVAGVGTLLVNFAISLGSVTLVNALVSVQYLFTFLLATVLGIYFKDHLQEKLTFSNVIFKAMGVVAVIVGVVLVS
jgi:drug/metabolite transporter (DMT)-like permease